MASPSCHATAPAATADSTACSQWQTRDAHARFAIRNSLPIDKREHFGQHKTAQALYTAVVARYSSPASAALGRRDLRLLRADAAAARAKGARAVVVTAGVAVVGEVVAGGVARVGEGVAVVGVAAAAGEVAGAEEAVGVAVDEAAAGVGVVEEVVAGVVVVEALAVARDSSTLPRPRRSVSGTLSTGGGGGGGGLSCTYVIRTGDRTGQPCGGPHATQRCFARLSDAWRVQFPQATELPRWLDLLKKGIDIYALDFDAILSAMYVMSTSGEGSEYLSVPPDPGIRTSASAAPGTHVSATPGAGEAAALVAVSLADPSGGPVIATSSTVLPCPAVPSGTLSGLHLPSFSTNLVAGCALRDGGVNQFIPAYERVTHCTCARTGRHLATFTRQPGSDLYTLKTASPQVAASASAFASASGSSLLSHPRLLLPAFTVSRGGSAPLLTPPRFPSTTAPLQTLHMDVWGPARVRGQSQERYFLIVVDDYSRYTTVFPLRTEGEVPDVLIPWIRRARLQLSERFRSDFPVLRLHSDRGGEFSSDLLAAYCAEHGIEQSFTLPASPQQNGVAERRIGLVMETSPTLLWTGEVGDASRFRVWGSRAFVRDSSADKLSSRAVPCVFLGFVPDAHGVAVLPRHLASGLALSGRHF
ncbi:unnamed protein product [Closterium sp. NIES-64]|nr:unnamed protein product [Closterium sp. NIES-64]